MAVTRKADVLAQIPDLWSTRMFYEAQKRTFWYKFEGGEGSDSPIVRKDDLEKNAGDTIKVDIALALTGAGATGDTALLEGNEEQLKFRQSSIDVDSLQHAVRWSKLGKILINHNMRETGLNLLKKHLAGRLDDQVWNELTGGSGATIAEASLPTSMKFFPSTASSVATVTSAMLPTLNEISEVKAWAVQNNMIEPLAQGDTDTGEEMYGLVLHTYAALALKKDTNYQQAKRDALERGKTNDLFKGSIGVWDNVVMYVASRVRTANDGAASAAVHRNVFFGAQAASRAYAYYPDWTEQYFSYGQEQGLAYFGVLGKRLNTFDLNAVETPADSTDDRAIGAMIYYTAGPAPTPAS